MAFGPYEAGLSIGTEAGKALAPARRSNFTLRREIIASENRT
jgi:hypothetical protein